MSLIQYKNSGYETMPSQLILRSGDGEDLQGGGFNLSYVRFYPKIQYPSWVRFIKVRINDFISARTPSNTMIEIRVDWGSSGTSQSWDSAGGQGGFCGGTVYTGGLTADPVNTLTNIDAMEFIICNPIGTTLDIKLVNATDGKTFINFNSDWMITAELYPLVAEHAIIQNQQSGAF